MSSARQSIMMRRRKAYSQKNSESLNNEYTQHQDKVDSAKDRYEKIGEERRKFLFGDNADKLELQERTREEMKKQLELKEELDKKELLDELKYTVALQEDVALAEVVEKDHERARREYLRKIMEENQQNLELKRQQEQEEKEKDAQMVSPDKDFFDRIPRSFRKTKNGRESPQT